MGAPTGGGPSSGLTARGAGTTVRVFAIGPLAIVVVIVLLGILFMVLTRGGKDDR